MPTPPPPSNRPTAKPWQPRFGLGGLMLVVLICSVMAAATSYFVQATRWGRSYQAVFIAVTLISPLLLAVIVSNVRALFLRRRRP